MMFDSIMYLDRYYGDDGKAWTYSDAVKAGYIDGECRLQAGYTSRKTATEDAPVYIAGGYRKGQLFALLPNYSSTRFCYRQYLVKPESYVVHLYIGQKAETIKPGVFESDIELGIARAKAVLEEMLTGAREYKPMHLCKSFDTGHAEQIDFRTDYIVSDDFIEEWYDADEIRAEKHIDDSKHGLHYSDISYVVARYGKSMLEYLEVMQ